MNKKADQVAHPTIIWGVLTVFLLVAGALAIYFFLGGGIDKAKAIFPSWGFVNQSQPQIALIRYDLQTDELKWYDGVNFNKFQNGKFEIGNKILDENTVKQDFTTSYYHKTDLLPPKTIKLDFSLTGGVLYNKKNFPSMYCAGFSGIIPIDYKKNSIVIALYSQNNNNCTNNVFGSILLIPDGQMTFQSIDTDAYENSGQLNWQQSPRVDVMTAWAPNWKPLYDYLYSQAYMWRNTLFNNPITIHYKENGVDKTGQFCVTPDREVFLVVDLSKPSTDCNRFVFGGSAPIQNPTKDPRQDIIFEYDDQTSIFDNVYYRFTGSGWQWSLNKQSWQSGENSEQFSGWFTGLNGINKESVKAIEKRNYLSGLVYLITARAMVEGGSVITDKVKVDNTGKFEVSLGSGTNVTRYINSGKKWLWSTDTIDWKDTSQYRNANAFTTIDSQALGQNTQLIIGLKDKSLAEGAEIIFNANLNKFPDVPSAEAQVS
jgi:hypothetical protein